MTTPDSQVDRPTWDACRPGELQSLGRRLRADARRERVATPILGAAAAACTIALVVAFSGETAPERITCTECASRFDAYHADLVARRAGQETGDQGATLVEVRHHLESCPHCRTAFEKAHPDVAWDLAATGAGVMLMAVAATILWSSQRRSSTTVESSPLCPTGS